MNSDYLDVYFINKSKEIVVCGKNTILFSFIDRAQTLCFFLVAKGKLDGFFFFKKIIPREINF